MIKLSDRLQVIANEIERNETMADVGTDHGFLPIYLWEQKISPKVVMTDVSPGSLAKAEREARRLYPEETFDLRLGDGIGVLEKGEVDVVVLAGMGGILMTKILAADPEKSISFKKLILQPRTGQGGLRHWLTINDYGIIKESLVREGKYICEVLTVKPNVQGISKELKNCDEGSIEYEVPPWITTAGPLAEPFIQRKTQAEEQILEGLLNAKTPNTARIQETKNRIQYLEKLLGGI